MRGLMSLCLHFRFLVPMNGDTAARSLFGLWGLLLISGGIHFLRRGWRTYPWDWRTRLTAKSPNLWNGPPEERRIGVRFEGSACMALGFRLFALATVLLVKSLFGF